MHHHDVLRHEIHAPRERAPAQANTIPRIHLRVELVAPHVHGGAGRHATYDLALLRHARAEDVRHIRVLRAARGAGAARAHLVKRQEPLARMDRRFDPGGGLLEQPIQLRFAHACGHLRIRLHAVRRIARYQQPRARLYPAPRRQREDERSVFARHLLLPLLERRHLRIVAPLHVPLSRHRIPHRERAPRPPERLVDSDLLDPHVIKPEPPLTRMPRSEIQPQLLVVERGDLRRHLHPVVCRLDAGPVHRKLPGTFRRAFPRPRVDGDLKPIRGVEPLRLETRRHAVTAVRLHPDRARKPRLRILALRGLRKLEPHGLPPGEPHVRIDERDRAGGLDRPPVQTELPAVRAPRDLLKVAIRQDIVPGRTDERRLPSVRRHHVWHVEDRKPRREVRVRVQHRPVADGPHRRDEIHARLAAGRLEPGEVLPLMLRRHPRILYVALQHKPVETQLRRASHHIDRLIDLLTIPESASHVHEAVLYLSGLSREWECNGERHPHRCNGKCNFSFHG